MSIKGQGHSLTLVKGHSDFKVKCLTFGLYTQVSDSGPLGPLVALVHWLFIQFSFFVFRLLRTFVIVFFATYLLLLIYSSAFLKQCSGAIVRFSESSSFHNW